MAAVEFVGLTNVDDGDCAVAEYADQVLEGRDPVTTQRYSVGQRAYVTGGAAGDVIDADTGEFALGVGDLFCVLPDQRQRCAPAVQPSEVVDERSRQLESVAAAQVPRRERRSVPKVDHP